MKVKTMDEEVREIAATLFAETKDIEDAKRIGSVMMNRLKNPKRFADNIHDIISAQDNNGVKQFTGYGSKEYRKVFDKTQRNDEENAILTQLIPIARQIYNGTLEDYADGADHYYNPKIANPYWGKFQSPRWDSEGRPEMYYKEVGDSGIHKYFKETLSPKQNRKSKR